METDQTGDCLLLWMQENNDIISQWRDCGNVHSVRLREQRCHMALQRLHQKIQGLPATFLSLPLELSVLYNMVIFHINLNIDFKEEHANQIEGTLVRVLEVVSPGVSVSGSVELWRRIFYGGCSGNLVRPIHRLAGLQGALWLAQNKLQEVCNLFSLLLSSEVSDPLVQLPTEKKLVALLRAWRVPGDEEEDRILTVQAVEQVKDVLCTSAACLLGVCAMEASDLSQAVHHLQEAAASLCSSRILAQVYTCLGWCFHKLEKPQTALQYWKQALQVDFHCLAALYHSACIYEEMGKTCAELEALELLYKALFCSREEASPTDPVFLLRTELIVKIPSVTCVVLPPSPFQVKHQIARVCLQTRRVEEASEHYLELLSIVHDGHLQDHFHNDSAPHRIPEVFLEAAASLLMEKRYNDAMTICQEIIARAADLIPDILSIDRTQGVKGGLPVITDQLNCIVWTSNAHLYLGHCQEQLGDPKESVTEFTKCLNLLLKVEFIDKGNGEGTRVGKEETVVRVLKAAAFLGRSQQFQKLGKHKEALLNAQFSLQVSPACRRAAFALTRLPGALGRKMAAESHQKRFEMDEEWEAMRKDLPLYLDIYVTENLEDPQIEELQEMDTESES